MINRVIITMGDPAGIGAEIAVKFFDNYYKLEERGIFAVLCGSKSIIEKEIEKIELL